MHPALTYFRYSPKNDSSLCIVNEAKCNVVIKGKHGTNLLNHLKRFHEKEHQLALDNLRSKKRRLNRDNCEETISKRCKMDAYVTRTEVSKVATVTFSDKTVIDACVEMVTKNGRPFRTLHDSGFRKILDPITKALNISINESNIQSYIATEADNWVDHIKSEVKGNVVILIQALQMV
jgi:hypothetical protein